jgi:IS5 family transposase
LADAAKQGIEKGRMVRIDSTVTETNIHPPADNTLLWDCARVMVRQMNQIKDALMPGAFNFCDHSRAAKKRMQRLCYTKGKKRKKLYKELIRYVKKIKSYFIQALSLTGEVKDVLMFAVFEQQATALLAQTDKVISQAERRIFNDEKVPAQEKIFSIFEEHTDIVIKRARDIQYDHKLNFTTGKSGLVLDVCVEEGNPADTARLCPMIERQKEIYGRVPRQVAIDGGYASKENLAKVKSQGVKDAAFHKKRGMEVLDMVKSEWVYKKLCKFRAGVEGNISCLKRRYGMSRCTWQGLDRFKAYAWASTVAYNLLTWARLEITAADS